MSPPPCCRPLGLGMLVALAMGCAPEAEAPPEPPVGTEVGRRAPGLIGELATGEAFALEARPGVPTVLVFYRGAHCGLCRVRLAQLQAHLPAYERQGVRVVAVTLDPAPLSLEMVQSMELDFPVVSADSATFETWGSLHAELRLPLPGTYLVDHQGVVRFRHIGRNAGDRVGDASLLTVIETLEGG